MKKEWMKNGRADKVSDIDKSKADNQMEFTDVPDWDGMYLQTPFSIRKFDLICIGGYIL